MTFQRSPEVVLPWKAGSGKVSYRPAADWTSQADMKMSGLDFRTGVDRTKLLYRNTIVYVLLVRGSFNVSLMPGQAVGAPNVFSPCRSNGHPRACMFRHVVVYKIGHEPPEDDFRIELQVSVLEVLGNVMLAKAFALTFFLSVARVNDCTVLDMAI